VRLVAVHLYNVIHRRVTVRRSRSARYTRNGMLR
jgi:hypothetical protein